MHKTLLLVLCFLVMGSGLIFGQEITLNTYEASPRDVARDTVDHYFDRAYNGLLNVGIETKMFFIG